MNNFTRLCKVNKAIDPICHIITLPDDRHSTYFFQATRKSIYRFCKPYLKTYDTRIPEEKDAAKLIVNKMEKRYDK